MAEKKDEAPTRPAARDGAPVAAGVRLEVPPGTGALGVGGMQFRAEAGWIVVPEALAGEARMHLASLWRAIEQDAKRVADAAQAEARAAEMPDWARRWTAEVERKLLGG